MKKEWSSEFEIPEELTPEAFQALINSPRFREYYRNAQGPAPQESDLARHTRELREAETREDYDRSLAWVMRVFKPMIRMREQKKCIYFAEITSTERTRSQGLTTLADKWSQDVSMPVGYMAVHYIKFILDDSLKTDLDKVEAMIEHDRAKNEANGKYEQAWRLIRYPKLELRTRFYT